MHCICSCEVFKPDGVTIASSLDKQCEQQQYQDVAMTMKKNNEFKSNMVAIVGLATKMHCRTKCRGHEPQLQEILHNTMKNPYTWY